MNQCHPNKFNLKNPIQELFDLGYHMMHFKMLPIKFSVFLYFALGFLINGSDQLLFYGAKSKDILRCSKFP